MSSNHRLLAAPPSRSPESPHFLRPVKKFHSDPHAAAGPLAYLADICLFSNFFTNFACLLPTDFALNCIFLETKIIFVANFKLFSTMLKKNFLQQKGPGAVCHFI